MALTTFLHGNRLLDAEEFANHLGLFATIARESDPKAGLALAYWAGMLKEIAHDLHD